jgi:hypothetical protein
MMPAEQHKRRVKKMSKQTFTGRAAVAHAFTRQQSKYRRAGIAPVWQTYIATDAWKEQTAGMDPGLMVELEALWNLCLEICPDRGLAQHQNALSYALAYIAVQKRNFAAFGLTAEQALKVEEAITRIYSVHT